LSLAGAKGGFVREAKKGMNGKKNEKTKRAMLSFILDGVRVVTPQRRVNEWLCGSRSI